MFPRSADTCEHPKGTRLEAENCHLPTYTASHSKTASESYAHTFFQVFTEFGFQLMAVFWVFMLIGSDISEECTASIFSWLNRSRWVVKWQGGKIKYLHVTLLLYVHPQYSTDCSSIEHLSEGTRNSPWRWQCNAETCRSYHTWLINWMNNWCICWFFTHI
jgi:hypothetical protein